jgi:hypothetical protein
LNPSKSRFQKGITQKRWNCWGYILWSPFPLVHFNLRSLLPIYPHVILQIFPCLSLWIVSKHLRLPICWSDFAICLQGPGTWFRLERSLVARSRNWYREID